MKNNRRYRCSVPLPGVFSTLCVSYPDSYHWAAEPVRGGGVYDDTTEQCALYCAPLQRPLRRSIACSKVVAPLAQRRKRPGYGTIELESERPLASPARLQWPRTLGIEQSGESAPRRTRSNALQRTGRLTKPTTRRPAHQPSHDRAR